ncbi:hypothetical protein TNCV_1438491 [Trichonephila clavipes]|nr:hypothetical protein TNCV_1438491 [Trichonephila clavipes]
MTPRDVLRVSCGFIFTSESKNVLVSKRDFVCIAELVSTSRSPDRNLLTDFGSPAIFFRALCMANDDFVDMTLFGKEINEYLTCVAVSSTLRLGKTIPLPGNSIFGSIGVTRLHPDVPPPTTESNKGAVCRSSGENQARRLPGVLPEYSATASGGGSNG